METKDTSRAPASKGSTRVSKVIKAPRTAVYHACIDPEAVVSWRVPDNMKGEMHEFDAREGGTFRMSLTYKDAEHPAGGKTSEDTDTFQGKFIELVPNEKIVELIDFEAEDPKFAGEMKITTSFADVKDGTEITILCQDIPPGIRPEDNEMGTRQSLHKLAGLLER